MGDKKFDCSLQKFQQKTIRESIHNSHQAPGATQRPEPHITRMASETAKQGRLTTEIHFSSIKNGMTEGFRRGWAACILASRARIAAKIGDPDNVADWDWEIKNADHEGAAGLEDFAAPKMLEVFMSDVDPWSLDPREDKVTPEKKPRKKNERKESKEDKPKPEKKSSGAWVDDPELVKKPFDPEFCNCRKWNAGYGAQCNRPVSEDDLCSLHKKQYDKIIENGGVDLSHGRYCEERPEKCLAKPEKEQVHKWKDLVQGDDLKKARKKKVDEEEEGAEVTEKKEKKKEKKEKKEKNEKQQNQQKKEKKKQKQEKKEKKEVPEDPLIEDIMEEAAVDGGAELDIFPPPHPEGVEAKKRNEQKEKEIPLDVQQDTNDDPQEEAHEEAEDSEETQELDDGPQDEDLTEDSTELKEIDFKGQTYMLNTLTKEVIDADDGEIVGVAKIDDEGEVRDIDFGGDDGSDDDSDSDSDSDSE